MAEYKLTTEIVRRSRANRWPEARLEWKLLEIFEAEEPDTCLCGHYPIIENCILRNKVNGNEVLVGNCCVKKFVGLPSDRIFQAVKRIRKDLVKSLNAEAVEHARERRWITQWERDFYMGIMRKKNLSPKQAAKKSQINEKVLRNMQRRTRNN
jgi:hypothetical protein